MQVMVLQEHQRMPQVAKCVSCPEARHLLKIALRVCPRASIPQPIVSQQRNLTKTIWGQRARIKYTRHVIITAHPSDLGGGDGPVLSNRARVDGGFGS